MTGTAERAAEDPAELDRCHWVPAATAGARRPVPVFYPICAAAVDDDQRQTRTCIDLLAPVRRRQRLRRIGPSAIRP